MGFIALMHLIRVIYKSKVFTVGKEIPTWVSIIGFIFSVILSISMFMTSRSFANLSSGDPMTLKLQSSVFNDGDSIPSKYTCNGKDISPPLSWHGEPDKTKSFVLLLDDPDAPNGTWNHFIVFNIPKIIHELIENVISLPNGVQYGKNSWGKSAYQGPCPPKGEHRYYFKLYALDTYLNLTADANKDQIESAMRGHILADTKLMGRYKKVVSQKIYP